MTHRHTPHTRFQIPKLSHSSTPAKLHHFLFSLKPPSSATRAVATTWLIFPSVLFLNLSANWYQKSLLKESLVSLFKMMSGSPWPWDKLRTHQGLWSTLVMCKSLLAFYLHLTRLHSSQSKCNPFILFWHSVHKMLVLPKGEELKKVLPFVLVQGKSGRSLGDMEAFPPQVSGSFVSINSKHDFHRQIGG